MMLDLGRILNQPGQSVPFQLDLDFSDMVFGGNCPASEPVHAAGTVRNEAGVLILNADLSTTLHCVCDRCASPFDRSFQQTVEAILVQEVANEASENDDWTFLLQGDCVDLDDVLTTGFVLNMDSKFLCCEDCKGLCSTCGKDLNLGPCDCKPEPDPRLAVLRQLLTDKE